jgi:hypothetical protein
MDDGDDGGIGIGIIVVPITVVTVLATHPILNQKSEEPQEGLAQQDHGKPERHQQPNPFPEQQRVPEALNEQEGQESSHETIIAEPESTLPDPDTDSSSNTNNSSKEGLKKDEYGIWILDSYQDFPVVLQRRQRKQQQQQDDKTVVPHGLMLVLFHISSKSCPTYQESWQTQLRDAAELVRRHVGHQDDRDDLLLHFGSVDTATCEGSSPWLASVGVETTPAYVFVVARNFLFDDEEKDHHPMTTATTSQQAFLLDYIGRKPPGMWPEFSCSITCDSF